MTKQTWSRSNKAFLKNYWMRRRLTFAKVTFPWLLLVIHLPTVVGGKLFFTFTHCNCYTVEPLLVDVSCPETPTVVPVIYPGNLYFKFITSFEQTMASGHKHLLQDLRLSFTADNLIELWLVWQQTVPLNLYYTSVCGAAFNLYWIPKQCGTFECHWCLERSKDQGTLFCSVPRVATYRRLYCTCSLRLFTIINNIWKPAGKPHLFTQKFWLRIWGAVYLQMQLKLLVSVYGIHFRHQVWKKVKNGSSI